MGVDMEMSCDERVIKEMGGEIKRDYSLLLLSLATNRRIISGSPLAFGEGGIKQRIKNVLNFKKPSRVIIIAAVVLVAILSIGLAVSKIVKEPLIETGMVNNDTTEYSNTDNLNNVSLAWPYLGEGISSRFGSRGNGFHSGIDIAGPTGDVVVAAETGEVIFAELYEGEEAYGNLIIIEHPNGMQTWYAHLSTFAVSKEQKVEKGQIIGEVGATGQATGPHLHFEVRVNDEPLNPLLYLSPIE
jgi:murein DD-endopeptidase MepM/ murein hydrolase activator NlpD